jgi:hypothetical protein
MEIIPDNKTCTKCKLTKALSEFSLKRARCKTCRSEDQLEYVERNKEAVVERKKIYYQENKELINQKNMERYYGNPDKEGMAERRREYYQDNKEHIEKRGKAYREKNKATIAEQKRLKHQENKAERNEKARRYYEANKGLVSEQGRAYREKNKDAIRERQKNNPEFKSNRLRYEMNRRALKMNILSEDFSTADVLAKWGIDCHLCMEPVDLDAPRNVGPKGWERGLHLEHVIGLANGGSHTLDNVKPSHAVCNLRKNRK